MTLKVQMPRVAPTGRSFRALVVGACMTTGALGCAGEGDPEGEFRHGLDAAEIHELVATANPDATEPELAAIEAQALEFFAGEFECPTQSEVCAQLGIEGAERWYAGLVDFTRMGLDEATMDESLYELHLDLRAEWEANGGEQTRALKADEVVERFYNNDLRRARIELWTSYNVFTNTSKAKAVAQLFGRVSTSSNNWFPVVGSLRATAVIRPITNVCTREWVYDEDGVGSWDLGGYTNHGDTVTARNLALDSKVTAVASVSTVQTAPSEYWITDFDTGIQYRFCGSGVQRGAELALTSNGITKLTVATSQFNFVAD